MANVTKAQMRRRLSEAVAKIQIVQNAVMTGKGSPMPVSIYNKLEKAKLQIAAVVQSASLR